MSSKFHPELPSHTVPRQLGGYHLENTPCCIVLKKPGSNDAIKLNESGALIWQMCNGVQSVGDIIQTLKRDFSEAADEIPKDVFRVLDTLRDEGALALSGDAPAGDPPTQDTP